MRRSFGTMYTAVYASPGEDPVYALPGTGTTSALAVDPVRGTTLSRSQLSHRLDV